MSKIYSDQELQNMSVEELQSLKNDLLPQKESPNYDTYTGGGRDYTGVCCDIADGCCGSACTQCDGICAGGETCLPNTYIDPGECEACPTIEYQTVYIKGDDPALTPEPFFISYPQEFLSNDFLQVLEASWSEDFDTGDLIMFTDGQFRQFPEFSSPGSSILFNSWIPHKVTPVTKGIRKTISHWFYGPRLI